MVTRQSYGASPAIWDHTVLPVTRHRWTCPTLNPAKLVGKRFSYPRGWKAELTWVVGYILRWFTCPQTGSSHLIATRPGVEPTTSRSQVQRPNRYASNLDNCSTLFLCWSVFYQIGISFILDLLSLHSLCSVYGAFSMHVFLRCLRHIE